MPSYAELEREECWRAQVVPPALEWLGESLRDHYGESRSNIGSPGDNRHLRGGHRSRRWIRESAYCTNDTYTVTHADDKLGDEDWYCAIDIGGLSQAELIAMCQRLDAAVRAGLLEECWEWYGNLGGDDRVDGWNNLENRLASSDSSHLYHLHMTFRRRYANSIDVMRRAFAILIGDDMLTPTQAGHLIATAYRLLAVATLNEDLAAATQIPEQGRITDVPLIDLLKRVDANAASAAAVGSVDPAALAAELLLQFGGHVTVTIADEQLARVIRGVLGGLDGATPAT
jgi:hypothetical protein